jgi:hypothetical protein
VLSSFLLCFAVVGFNLEFHFLLFLPGLAVRRARRITGFLIHHSHFFTSVPKKFLLPEPARRKADPADDVSFP